MQRRVLRVIVASQMLGGMGLAAGVTVGALLAEQLLGSANLAGLPATVFTLGSAAAAFAVGRISQTFGRRIGLTAGFLTGGLGAAGVVVAAVANSVIILFVALLIYGAGSATNLQARYAGTDLAHPHRRARAVSLAMVATTLGAVAGPNLVAPMRSVANALGVPALAGPFLLAAVAYLAAGFVLLVWLRPDPLLLARAVSASEGADAGDSERADAGAAAEATATARDTPRSAKGPSRANRGIAVGTTVMVVTQVAMLAIMTMTPVRLRSQGQGLAEIGLVIGIHIGFMYIPSLVTGTLVDRVGRIPMSIAAGITLLLAGVTAATAPPQGVLQLMIALALLGIGWNFGVIAGTALIVDATPEATRAKTQGTIDVLIALAGATGGALSGIVVAGSSFAVLSLGGGILSLLLIPAVIWLRLRMPIRMIECPPETPSISRPPSSM